MLSSTKTNDIRSYSAIRPLKLVYLFGSQANNQAGPASDYDFAILFDHTLDSSHRFDLKLDFINFLTSLLKTDKVDIVDLNSAPVRFAFEASVKGKCLYGNRQVQDDFEFTAFRMFQDQKYYLKRYAEQTVARIATQGFE